MDDDKDTTLHDYVIVDSTLSESCASDSSAELGSADIWMLLERKGLLSACSRAWFKLMMDMWISASLACLVAVASGYLAVVPDRAMCEAYGERLARALCMVVSLISVMEVLHVIGASMALHSDAVKDAVEQHGDAAVVCTAVSDFGASWPQRVRQILVRTSLWLSGILVVVQFWRGTSLLTRTMAVAASIHRGSTLEACVFARELPKALSIAMVVQLQKRIQAFPMDAPHPDDDFWEKAVDRYKDMDILLERLWKSTMVVFVSFIAGRVLLIIIGVVLCIQAVHVGDWATQMVCIAFIVYYSRAILVILHALASITESCISRSLATESIFSTAVKKLGTNRMTDRQKETHLVFLRCLELSPAGVQMGTLVDTALVLRVGTPFLTGVVSFISYILATLEITGVD